MRDLEVPSSSPSPFTPPRRSAVPQLLIEMPAESAARLLVRSLLEQVSHLAAQESVPLDDRWRVAADRLSTSVALYADVLIGSIPRKARRRVRQLPRQANRLHRAEAQLAWLSQFPPADDDGAAAAWLRQRVMRRQLAARAALERAHRDVAKLQRLSKSLGVYTTAVRLDDMPPPRSFAALTGDLVRDEAEQLRKGLAGLRPTRIRSVRRALDASRRLGYLLEPVRVHMVGMTSVTDRLGALQDSLERLAELGAVATAILRAGRRAGGLYMTTVVRAELFEQPSSEAAPQDLRAGLLALARRLRGEIVPAFEQFASDWGEEEIGGLAAGLDACTAQLRS
jgi:hypothetical protein